MCLFNQNETGKPQRQVLFGGSAATVELSPTKELTAHPEKSLPIAEVF